MKIEITEELANKFRKRVEETNEFDNVQDYINYVLEQVAENLDGDETEEISEEDEEKIEERLRGLGYLG